MKKVSATLLYGIDEHNKYMAVKFFAVEKSGAIHTFIDNTNNMNLAFRDNTMEDMIRAMKGILRTDGYYVPPFAENSVSECCGIVCLKMYGTDFLVSNPTRVWVSK